MPVTRADLKISRDYHNRVAFSKYPFFSTIITGLGVSFTLITFGVLMNVDYVAFASFPVAFFFAMVAISIEKVKERPHQRLQRLMVETQARKELDFAKR